MNAIFMGFIFLTALSMKKSENDDCLAKDNILPVKGFFTLLIILSHYTTYYQVTAADNLYMAVKSHLGQSVVAIFFFYSGYGIMTQIKNNGDKYLQRMPLRFLRVLIDFDLAVVLYIILRVCQGQVYSIKRYMLTLIGWDGIGNSNWFILNTLCLYAAVIIAFSNKLSRRKPIIGAVLTFIISATMLIGLKYAGKEAYWYNTMMIFPAGMLYAFVREKVDIIYKNKSSTVQIIIIAIAVCVYCMAWENRNRDLLLNYIWICAYIILVLLFTVRYTICNELCRFAGNHVFSIYILQRIPMMVFSYSGFLKVHPYICFFYCFAITIILSVIFDIITSKLHECLRIA